MEGQTIMNGQKEKTIIEEYIRYVGETVDRWTIRLESSKIVIFDLDGVIADVRHRVHFIDPEISKIVGKSVNWDKFFEACPNDIPNKGMIDLLKLFVFHGHRIYILSSRSATVEKETLEWFSLHNIPFDFMFLRPIENYSAAFMLKTMWINKIIELEGLDNIFMAFDNDEKNIEVFREAGIQSFHVVINYEDVV